MKVECFKKNQVLVVQIAGEIDHHTCEVVRNQVDDTLEKMNGRYLVLDMQNVTFMDSSGIGVIIGRYKLIQRLEGKICIVSANPVVDQILKFSAISKLMKCVETLEEATTYLEGVSMNGI